MSGSYDNKVVEMRFDGKQFEAGVESSYSAINKLKQALNFNDAAKSFDNLENASKNVKMSGITSAVETATHSFSSLEIIAISALNNITNKAVDAGIKMAKALTIDQMAAGWQQFGQKTTDVATMMIATGRSAEDISSVMDKVTWFADETSYSFSEMTSSVSKFVSNGVGLEDSVTAVQGIATWAAKAGQNSQTASRAMYNLTQAIGMGSLKAQDWKSIELANMATKDFKETAINAAKELAKTDKDYAALFAKSDVSVENFRETLQTGWLNNTVLLDTLSKYGEYADYLYENREGYDTASEAMAALGANGMEFGMEAFKAAQQARTLTDAINSVKDAAKSKFANMFEAMFGNSEFATQTFTDVANGLWDVFVGPLDNIASAMEKALSPDPLNQFGADAEAAGFSVDKLKEALTDLGLKSGKVTQDMIDDAGGIENTLKTGWLDSATYAEALSRSTGNAAGSLEDYISSVSQNWNTFQKQRYETWMKQGRDIKDLGNTGTGTMYKWNQWMYDELGLDRELLASLGDLTEEQQNYIDAVKEGTIELTGYDEEVANQMSGQEMIRESMTNLIGIMESVKNVFSAAWNAVFPDDGTGKVQAIYSTVESVYNAIKRIKESLEEGETLESSGSLFQVLYSGFSSLISVANAVVKAMKLAFSAIKAVVGDSFIGDSLAIIASSLGIVSDLINAAVEAIIGGSDEIQRKLPASLSTFTSWLRGAVTALREWLNAGDKLKIGVAKIVNAFKRIGSQVKSFIGQFINLDAITTAFNNFISGITAKFPTFNSFFDAFAQAIANIKDRLSQLDGKISFSNLKAALQAVREELGKLFNVNTEGGESISGVFQAIEQSLGDFGNGAVTQFEGITARLKAAFDTLKGIFSNTYQYLSDRWENGMLNGMLTILVGIASGAATLSLVQKLGTALKLLATPIDLVSSLISGITTTLSALRGDLKALKFDIYMNGFKQIALALLALSAAMMLLSYIKPGKLIIVATIIGAFMAAIIAIEKLSLTADPANVTSVAKLAASFAAAFIALAIAFKIMAATDMNKAMPALISAGIVLGVLAGIAYAMKKLQSDTDKIQNGDNYMKSSMVGMIMSIVGIAAALWILSKVHVTWNAEMFGKIAAVIIAIGVIAAIAAKGGKEMSKGMHGIESIGKSIFAIVAAIAILSRMSLEDVWSAFLKIGLIEGLMWGLSKILKIAEGKNADKAGHGMQSMASTIVVMAAAMAILGKMKPSEILKGAAGLAAISVAMLAMGHALKAAGQNQISTGAIASIISMGIAIVMIAGSLIALGNLTKDGKSLAGATGAISAILGVMSLLAASAKGLDWSSFANLLAIAGVVGVVAAALYVLANFTDTESLNGALNALGTMTSIIGMLAIVLAVAGKLDLGSAAAQGIEFLVIAMVTLAVVVASLVGMAALLDKIPDIVPKMEKLAMVFELIGRAFGGLIGGTFEAALSGIGNGLANIITAFEGLKGSDSLQAAESLANIAGALKTLSKIKMDKIDISGLSAVMSEIGTVIGQFAGSLPADLSLDTVNNAMTALTTVFEAVSKLPKHGGVMQKIFGETMSSAGLTAMLTSIGTGLLMFSHSIAGITIDPDTLSKYMGVIKTLGEALETLPTFGGLNGMLEGNKIDATAVGEYMSAFSTAISNISSLITEKKLEQQLDNIRKVADIIDQLAEAMSKIPQSASKLTIGDWFKWSGGETDTEGFKTFISSLGANLESINELGIAAKGKTGLDPAVIENAAKCTEMLADAMGRIGTSGGLKGAWTGTTDTTAFGKFIDVVGTGLAEFSDKATQIDADAIAQTRQAVYMVEGIARAFETIKNSTKATDNGYVYSAFKAISDSLAEFDKFDLSSSTVFKSKLQNLNEGMEMFGSFAENAQSGNISVVSSYYTTFAESIGKLNEVTGSFNTEALTSIMTQLNDTFASIQPEQIVMMAQAISDLGTILTGAFAESTLGTGEDQPSLMDKLLGINQGDTLKGAKELATDVAQGLAQTATQALSSVEISPDAGTAIAQNMANSIALGAESADTSPAATALFSKVESDGVKKGQEIGKKSGKAVVNGMSSVSTYSIGVNFGQGFINGLNSKLGDIRAAGANAGNVAYQAMADALHQGSPSKLTYQSGLWFDEGFANGINAAAGLAEEAATSAGTNALTSLSESMAHVATVFSHDFDVQPVITPVLDLTNVEAGARSINATVSNVKGLSVQAAMSPDAETASIQNGNTSSQIQYIQNNYSPKSLSRIEIYRQTRNQLAALKG